MKVDDENREENMETDKNNEDTNTRVAEDSNKNKTMSKKRFWNDFEPEDEK